MRVGVIGVGRLGSLFARILAGHPAVTELALAGSKPGSADELADELGVQSMPDADRVLAVVDAVVIAASTAAHPELVRRAAAAGLPTFCEKPIALDLATTDELIELAASAGIELQVGFQRRFDAGYVGARDLIRSGRLGDIYLVRTASHDPAPSPESFIATSGDLFRDLVIHDFDAVRFVTNREIEEVFAVGGAGFPEFEPYRAHADHGLAVGTMRLSGGSQAVFTATRHNPAGYDVRMEIFGSAGSIAVGWDARMPLRSIEPGSPPAPIAPYCDFLDRFSPAYRAEMHAFVDLVLKGTDNVCPPHEARAAFVVALAAGRSAAQGRPVPVSEIT